MCVGGGMGPRIGGGEIPQTPDTASTPPQTPAPRSAIHSLPPPPFPAPFQVFLKMVPAAYGVPCHSTSGNNPPTAQYNTTRTTHLKKTESCESKTKEVYELDRERQSPPLGVDVLLSPAG